MGGSSQECHGTGEQADCPKWIKPALIDQAKQVLQTSCRQNSDDDSINLIVSLSRLLDAAGVLRSNRP